MKNGVKNIQAVAYNGAHTVSNLGYNVLVADATISNIVLIFHYLRIWYAKANTYKKCSLPNEVKYT